MEKIYLRGEQLPIKFTYSDGVEEEDECHHETCELKPGYADTDPIMAAALWEMGMGRGQPSVIYTIAFTNGAVISQELIMENNGKTYIAIEPARAAFECNETECRTVTP